MRKIIRIFASLAYLTFVSTASANQAETRFINDQSNDRSLPQLFEAQRLLFAGELVLAGKAFKSIANNPTSNPLVKKYAKSKLSTLTKNNRIYTKSFIFSPFQPSRNYKTDTLNVNVNGSTLPFKISREKNQRNVVTFNQKLDFNTWQLFDYNPIDIFSLSHELLLNSDSKFTNSVDLSFTNKTNVNNENKLHVKFTKPQGNNGFVKEVGLDTKVMKGRHLIDLSWSKSFMIKQNLTYDQVSKYSISHKVNLLKMSISSSLEFNNFSDQSMDHTYMSLGTEMPVSYFFDSLSIRYQKRLDEEVQFLMPRKRRDDLYSLSFKKYLQIAKMNSIMSIRLTRNASNIEIYSFDEVGLDFALRF